MKVTVSFGDIRVVVPCGNGELLIKDLIIEATTRYKKATNKVLLEMYLTNIGYLTNIIASCNAYKIIWQVQFIKGLGLLQLAQLLKSYTALDTVSGCLSV